jgi:phosphatidate cytidylyltransferase
MLKLRVITAVLLLALLLPALLATAFEPFAYLVLILLVAAAWEWARLIGVGVVVQALFCTAVGMVCIVRWDGGFAVGALDRLAHAASLAWLLVLAVSLSMARLPDAAMRGAGRGLHLLFAGLALVVAWEVAVAAKRQGPVFVLSLLALVWAADIAAYFAGRAFGRHKLAPAISPGKTWEGAAGGVAAAVVLGLALYRVEGSFYFALADGSVGKLVGLTALLAAVSIGGDLFESLLKRYRQVKDSSALLPGHGGVLDRIDALLPTLPLAWILL